MDMQTIAGKLKLSYIKEHYQDEITQAEHTRISYEEFLKGLLEREMQRRKENGVVRRIRYANSQLRNILLTLIGLSIVMNSTVSLTN